MVDPKQPTADDALAEMLQRNVFSPPHEVARWHAAITAELAELREELEDAKATRDAYMKAYKMIRGKR